MNYAQATDEFAGCGKKDLKDMIGSIISGALQVGSSIFGGIQASKAMKRYKANVEDEKEKNREWYDRRYNEDATQRADAQRMLTQTQEAIRNRNKAAAGTQAVMGGTEESVAATKAANAQALADAASQIAAAGARRKDSIEAQYRQRDAELQEKLNNIEINKAGQIATATRGIGETMGNLATGIEDLVDANATLKEYRKSQQA